MTGHLKDNLFVLTALQVGLRGAVSAQLWSKNLIFLRYTYITHLIRSQTDPTQWDQNIPISWGNSGYLWFSGRCPFGCSAGRCMAPIAENYHFWAKNAYYSIVSHGIVCYCMELNCILWYCICYNHDGTPKRQLWLYTLTCHNISKRFAAGCYFERASTNLVDFLDKQIIILVCSWLRRAGNASQGVSIYFIINSNDMLYSISFGGPDIIFDK